MNQPLIMALAVITGLATAGAAHATAITLIGEDAAQAENGIRRAGGYCERAETAELVEKTAKGEAVYRIHCGPAGPDYKVVIKPNGSEWLLPW